MTSIKLLYKESVCPVDIDEFPWTVCPCNLLLCAKVNLAFGETKPSKWNSV